MRNKLDEVDYVMREYQLHTLSITVTWHEDAECVSIKRLHSLAYHLIEAARPLQSRNKDADINYINHGGIAFVSKPGVLVAKMDLTFTASTFEFLCCRVIMAGASIVTLTIYRPGSQSICVAFFDELIKLLE